MRFARYVSVVDVIVAVMVLFVLWLPPRKLVTAWASTGTEAERWSLALAEARSIQDPQDGALIAEVSRRLGAASFQDWAIEAAARGSAKVASSPSRWRAYLATSVAYVERLDAVPALDYARRALTACGEARALDERVCPSWEEVRMDLYAKHLDAGVASGIDPHQDPKGFRLAGEAALRTMRIREPNRPVAPTTPTTPTTPTDETATPPAAPATPAAPTSPATP